MSHLKITTLIHMQFPDHLRKKEVLKAHGTLK